MAEALQRSEATCMDILGQEMLLNKSHRISTIMELADKVSINRRHLPHDIVCLAAAFLECQQAQRHKLEANLVGAVNGEDDLLMYVDCAAYDETPMPVVAKDLILDQNLEQLAAALPLEDKAHVPGVICNKPLPSVTESGKVTCKLFQSEQSYVMSSRTRGERGTFYSVIDGDDIDMLQRLSSTDAKSTQNALTRVCNVSVEADKFQTKVRIATTHEATPNPLCENI